MGGQGAIYDTGQMQEGLGHSWFKTDKPLEKQQRDLGYEINPKC